MEIAASVNSKRVSAFQQHTETYEHWCEKRQRFVRVEHRGYVVDADNFCDATTNLISMVRPMHYDLGERMMDSVKNFGVNAK